MNCFAPKNTMVPGEIYLCQVDEVTACGACCGLYNLPNISREMLLELLTRRTSEFAAIPRKIAALDAFALKETELLHKPKPFSDFHHCPYLGLIGPAKSRVGCLLHPLAEGNEGIDYRGMSYYGGMACRDYFCPATRHLAPEVKLLLRDLEADWYAYGLVVTELKLHQAVFAELKNRSHDKAALNCCDNIKSLSRWRKDLLMLKLNWPFRDPAKSLCHYLFDDTTHERPAIDYDRFHTSTSRYDAILRELDSRIESHKDLAQAEFFIDRLFDKRLTHQ